MLSNLIVLQPYKLDLRGLDWTVDTDGTKLDITGRGWALHRGATDGQQAWSFVPGSADVEKHSVSRIGQTLDVIGDGWSVHTTPTTLDVVEGIGYSLDSHVAVKSQLPGLTTNFIPANDQMVTSSSQVLGKTSNPITFKPFSTTCVP